MDASNYWIWWIVGSVLSLVLIAYLLLEYIAWLERTQVVAVPAGLRFVARALQVEMQRGKKRVIVQAQRGHYNQQARNGVPALEKTGALTATFEAQGLRFSSTPEMNPGTGKDAPHPSGLYTLAFNSTEDQSSLRIERVPSAVAADFEHFSQQVVLWIERLEARKAEQDQAAAAAAAAAAATAAAASQQSNPSVELTADAQVAAWRKRAGFSGTSSEIGLDDKGRVSWFVDLDPTGRITLHSNSRTVHTTLQGAEFISLGGELEVAVRDEFWSEEHHTLARFRILKGRSPDERRAWKERLELLRNQLEAQSHARHATH